MRLSALKFSFSGMLFMYCDTQSFLSCNIHLILATLCEEVSVAHLSYLIAPFTIMKDAFGQNMVAKLIRLDKAYVQCSTTLSDLDKSLSSNQGEQYTHFKCINYGNIET